MSNNDFDVSKTYPSMCIANKDLELDDLSSRVSEVMSALIDRDILATTQINVRAGCPTGKVVEKHLATITRNLDNRICVNNSSALNMAITGTYNPDIVQLGYSNGVCVNVGLRGIFGYSDHDETTWEPAKPPAEIGYAVPTVEAGTAFVYQNKYNPKTYFVETHSQTGLCVFVTSCLLRLNTNKE